jgi:putative endonuclease
LVLGEEMAVEFLRKDGYLQTNYTFQKAEIDILAQKRKHTCCCRSQNAFFFEFDCLRILLNQKNPALVAVDAFVNERDLDIEVRFDIIAINKEGNSFVIEHLIDAFYHF